MEAQLYKTDKVIDILARERGEDIAKYVENHVDTGCLNRALVLETGSALTLESIVDDKESCVDVIINIKRLNDIQYINKFLEAANRNICDGGIIVGCFETKENRKKRIFNKFPFPLNFVHYTVDFSFKRVVPKLYGFKRLYFALTRGQNRVISKMEGYGRIYSCGFELIHSKNFGNLRYFIARKIGEPAYNMKATYGPIIRLRRVGKGGKIFPVYKLRTMHPFSEYLQPYISEKYGLREGGKFRNDPRITTLGKFFRKFWLDELPMLYNMLKGDMKLVGVRPISSHYLSLYPKDVIERRKNYKPGLLPPFYADLPKTIDEIVASEIRYMDAHDKNRFLTDFRYFFKILNNILIKRARSN
jgi:lipopolysaccharide/colanic/teichoic acid biosynthesis glycosyltransferase